MVVNYASSKEGVDRVVEEIVSHGGRAVAVQANVAKRDEIERLLLETKEAFGRLDILVNNAGIHVFSALDVVKWMSFHKQFDLKVLVLVLTSQEAAKHFGPAGGNIVNVSSRASTFTPANASVYSATKAAVEV